MNFVSSSPPPLDNHVCDEDEEDEDEEMNELSDEEMVQTTKNVVESSQGITTNGLINTSNEDDHGHVDHALGEDEVVERALNDEAVEMDKVVVNENADLSSVDEHEVDQHQSFPVWPTSISNEELSELCNEHDKVWTANFSTDPNDDDDNDNDDEFAAFESAAQSSSEAPSLGHASLQSSHEASVVKTETFTKKSLEAILEELRPLVTLGLQAEQEDSRETEEVSLDPESMKDPVWLELCNSEDSDSSAPSQWSSSESHNLFLSQLRVNRENIFEGTSRSRPTPAFAQVSLILQPTVVSSNTDPKETSKESNDMDPSVSTVEFDWRSSGLEDPLASSDGSVAKEKSDKENVDDEEKLRAEAQKIVDSFPLLNFMRSPTLLTNNQS